MFSCVFAATISPGTCFMRPPTVDGPACKIRARLMRTVRAGHIVLLGEGNKINTQFAGNAAGRIRSLQSEAQRGNGSAIASDRKRCIKEES